MLATLILLAPLFSELPKAVLAAIIIDAVVFGMIDIPELRRLYRVTRFDFWIAVAAILGVLSAGVLAGVVIGILLSLGWLIYVATQPAMPLLGREPARQDPSCQALIAPRRSDTMSTPGARRPALTVTMPVAAPAARAAWSWARWPTSLRRARPPRGSSAASRAAIGPVPWRPAPASRTISANPSPPCSLVPQPTMLTGPGGIAQGRDEPAGCRDQPRRRRLTQRTGRNAGSARTISVMAGPRATDRPPRQCPGVGWLGRNRPLAGKSVGRVASLMVAMIAWPPDPHPDVERPLQRDAPDQGSTGFSPPHSRRLMKVGLMVPQGWKGEYDGWDPATAWARTVELRVRPRPSASSRSGCSITSTPCPSRPTS